MSPLRWSVALTAVVTALAIVPVTGAATNQDLRSPDARDAGLAAEARAYQDLRSPDARDAALAAEARNYQDLRSPDARDAGRVPSAPAPTPDETATSTGTDWTDVRIVAGGALGLVLVGLGGVLLLSRRTRTIRKARASVASS